VKAMSEEFYMQSFTAEDWGRIIRALHTEARDLNEDSRRAYNSASPMYGAILLDEAKILYDLADSIDLILP